MPFFSRPTIRPDHDNGLVGKYYKNDIGRKIKITKDGLVNIMGDNLLMIEEPCGRTFTMERDTVLRGTWYEIDRREYEIEVI